MASWTAEHLAAPTQRATRRAPGRRSRRSGRNGRLPPRRTCRACAANSCRCWGRWRGAAGARPGAAARGQAPGVAGAQMLRRGHRRSAETDAGPALGAGGAALAQRGGWRARYGPRAGGGAAQPAGAAGRGVPRQRWAGGRGFEAGLRAEGLPPPGGAVAERPSRACGCWWWPTASTPTGRSWPAAGATDLVMRAAGRQPEVGRGRGRGPAPPGA